MLAVRVLSARAGKTSTKVRNQQLSRKSNIHLTGIYILLRSFKTEMTVSGFLEGEKE